MRQRAGDPVLGGPRLGRVLPLDEHRERVGVAVAAGAVAGANWSVSTQDGTLDAIHDACRSQDNLLARFVDAAHAWCTLGEIADVLRAEFGEYEEPKIL